MKLVSLLVEILNEDESLYKWFKRQGTSGKEGGWVDCNTCRKDKKTSRLKCKACGRKKGETRAKYPACRPTPSQCKKPGKGKTWGKTNEAGSLAPPKVAPTPKGQFLKNTDIKIQKIK